MSTIARLVAFLALLLPVCTAAAPLSGKLVSTGSDTLGVLTALWAQALMQEHPGVNVQVRAIGSSAAPTALIEGTTDIGPMSRPMSRAELDDFQRRYGYAPTAIPVALDTLAVFVHRDNPLRSLYREELDALFSATRRCGGTRPLRRWDALGLRGSWSQRPIVRYGRSAASGTYGFFRRRLLCRGDFAAEVNRLVGSAAVVSAVANDRYGIGYASAGYLDSGVRSLRVRDSNGEQMLLSRELYLYVNLPPDRRLPPLVAAFVETALGRAGQASVRAAGYAPLSEVQRATLRQNLLPYVD